MNSDILLSLKCDVCKVCVDEVSKWHRAELSVRVMEVSGRRGSGNCSIIELTVDSIVLSIYPLNNDLSSGKHYFPFEQI